jgi:antirestriction protein ArdC
MSSAVYAIITDCVVALLERGIVPWRKPWGGPDGLPQNLVSKREYRGVNTFMLASAGFASPFWVTFNQAKAKGGSVRKGEKSSPVVFWKVTDAKMDDDGVTIAGKRFILRYYNVFNVAQCEGIDDPSARALPEAPFQPIDRCEAVVADMPDPPTIEHGETRAYYRPTIDMVNMPRRELFSAPAEYYSTLFHELAHATGHPSRIGRKGILQVAAFGSGEYSREELVAEMGAAFLCGHCGVEQATIENSAAYIGNWLRKLKDDRTLIVQAAAAAQKASDYILNRQAAQMADASAELAAA